MREIFAQAATFNNLLSLCDIVVILIPSPSIGAYLYYYEICGNLDLEWRSSIEWILDRFEAVLALFQDAGVPVKIAQPHANLSVDIPLRCVRHVYNTHDVTS